MHRSNFARRFLSVLFGILFAAAIAFPQTSAGDDSDKFIGKWFAEADSTGPDEMSSRPRHRIELQITKNASGFTVTRSDRVRNDNDPEGEKSSFRYSNGRLERDSSPRQTWEPTEFPKRIVERLKISPNGKKLIFTTVLHSAGIAAIPGANRRPVTLSETFSRVKN